MSYGFETIGGLVGGMAGGGIGLVGGAVGGGVGGAGVGALAGGAAGAVVGAPTVVGGAITIPGGAASGAVAGGIAGAAVGGGYGAVYGAQYGVDKDREWGKWLSEKIDGAEEKAKAKPQTEADTDCKGCKTNPCEHLKKGKGDGPYSGGGHGDPNKDVGTSSPRGDELDSHHVPAKQSYKGSGLDPRDGPAIQMRPEDHQDTADYGGRGQSTRDAQKKLIDSGNFDEAFDKSADNVREIAKSRGDPERYDEAIEEARAYKDCLKKHGLLPKGSEEK